MLVHCRMYISLFYQFSFAPKRKQHTNVDAVQPSAHFLLRRWLLSGQLLHVPATAVEASTTVGVALFLDFFSIATAIAFLRLLISGGHFLTKLAISFVLWFVR